MTKTFKLISKDQTLKEVTCAELERIFNFRYLPNLEIDHWRIERWLRKKCQKAHKQHKIEQLHRWLGRYHAKQIELDYTPDITIKWISPKIGHGVIPNQDLPAWEYLGEYTGRLRRRNLICRNINDYCFMYPKEWLSLKEFTIDSKRQGNFTRFINHSDAPNCESVAVFYEGLFRIIFRTLRPIKAGEELSYDYGDIYWKSREKI